MHLETLVEVLEGMDGRVSDGLWLSCELTPQSTLHPPGDYDSHRL